MSAVKPLHPLLVPAMFFLVSCSPQIAVHKSASPDVKKETNSTSNTNTPAPPVKNKLRGMQKYYRATGTIIGTATIIVDKSDYELRVYDAKGLYAVYPVVFGLEPLEDKLMQGDRKTPEGSFKIIYTKQHQLWHRMLMLDYPTKESIARFNARKKNGQVPATATPGNGIGIHGVEAGNDRMIDHYYNWTNGCISLKNHHIEDLASYINAGTVVKIQK